MKMHMCVCGRWWRRAAVGVFISSDVTSRHHSGDTTLNTHENTQEGTIGRVADVFQENMKENMKENMNL